jgi:hypothetical protein
MNEPITKAHLIGHSAPICRKMPEKSVNVVLNDKSIYSGKYIFINIELNESEK